MAILKLTPNMAKQVAFLNAQGEQKESPGGYGTDFLWKVKADGVNQDFYAKPDLNHVLEMLIINTTIKIGAPVTITKATNGAGKMIHHIIKHRNGVTDTANVTAPAPTPAPASDAPIDPMPWMNQSAPAAPAKSVNANYSTPASSPAPASGAQHAPCVADKAALYAQCFMEMLVGMRGLNGNGLGESEIRQAATAVFIECGKSNIRADRTRIAALKAMLDHK